MSVTDKLLSNAESYAASYDKASLPMPPGLQVAIVACMDARINPYGIFGLTEGDAHLIRNAGGAITEDAIRSLAISRRLLGTEEIILIHHNDCGMRTFTDEDFHGRRASHRSQSRGSPTAPEVQTAATPIRPLRVTRSVRSCSDAPSVPSGRRGRTMWRDSALASQTVISTCSGTS